MTRKNLVGLYLGQPIMAHKNLVGLYLGRPIMARKILWAFSWAGPFKLYGPLLGRATCRRIIGAFCPVSG